MAAKFLGQFLLEQGLIDRQQLLDALQAQRASNPLLGALAVDVGMLDANQAEQVNARQRSEDKRFGDIAQAMGLLTTAQVDELLARQESGRKLFGEILVEQGALTHERLADALKSQQHDRDDAIKALELGASGQAAGDVLGGAIDTCTRLFPRLLKTQCQFSCLVGSPDETAGCEVTACVRIQAQRPLSVALGCDRATMANIAGAFLSLPPGDCDAALAQDALGELVNVLMGYIVKDTLPEDAAYRASPPDFEVSARDLLSGDPRTLAVAMTSPPGPFVLLVSG